MCLTCRSRHVMSFHRRGVSPDRFTDPVTKPTLLSHNMFTEVHVNFNAWVCARTSVPREVVFMNDYDVQQDTVDPSAKDESLLVDP